MIRLGVPEGAKRFGSLVRMSGGLRRRQLSADDRERRR
jgi:hypothetical protein